MNVHCAECFIVLGCLAVAVSPAAQSDDYNHFVGAYAYEATPQWVEFEIVRTGDVFALQGPGGGGGMLHLKASDNSLVGQEEDSGPLSIQYDPASGRYALAVRTQASTFSGLQDVRFRASIVKAKPMPGTALEEQYGVTAAALVRGVRQSEQWMHEFDSLHFVADVTWTHTPAGIEHRKREIMLEHPDADLSREAFWGIKPLQMGTEEFYIDRRRFRASQNYIDKHEQVQMWDGQLFTAYNKYYTHEQEEYYIDPELSDRGATLLAGLAWLRSQTQQYWWSANVEMNVNPDDWDGRPEDFILMGKGDYHGVSCYVLECRPSQYHRVRRWYVGIDDGLLRGNLSYSQGQLESEYWTEQYDEVRDGWWFPTVQGYHVFDSPAMVATKIENATREDGMDHFISGRRDIVVKSIEVNQPLADEVFRMKFKEGVKVADLRFGGIVTYPYKQDRSDAEWEEIRTEARQRAERDAALQQALDARIGQEAPAFPVSSVWMNSMPLTWSDLRGKAVLLQFWGRNCGPCHNYIGGLKAPRDDSDIVVLGILTPDEDIEAVQELLAKYEADGPICVDVWPEAAGQGFGAFSAWFGVKAIPSWVVVGPDGKVAGHSMVLSDAFQIARSALAEISD